MGIIYNLLTLVAEISLQARQAIKNDAETQNPQICSKYVVFHWSFTHYTTFFAFLYQFNILNLVAVKDFFTTKGKQ